MRSQHNLLVLTGLLITQAVLAGHLCTAGESDTSTFVNPSVVDLGAVKRVKINLEVNSSCILTAKNQIPKALSNNPTVVKLVPVTPTKMQVAALQPGATTISFWHENGEMRTVDVIVTAESGQLKSFLDRLYPKTKIEVVPLNSSVVLRGFVDDPRTVNEIRQIAEDFYPKVISQLTVRDQTSVVDQPAGDPRNSIEDDDKAAAGSLRRHSLEHEIRSLREEVGALRREIGQLTDVIKNAQAAKPGTRTSGLPVLPRSSSTSLARPPLTSSQRVGWPVPHTVTPHPTATRVEGKRASRVSFERPVQVMMEARIFELQEAADKAALDKADRSGESAREAAALVRAVLAGHLPEAKAVSAQLIEGNLVGAIDADEKRLSEWTEQLIAHDLAKVVSRPTLVTLNGQTATIQKGGEFPIMIPQQRGTVSVEYRQFGTRIEMIPKVVDDQRIQLHVRPQFSELDADQGVSVSGHTIPRLNTVQVQTAVELKKGQSLLIGGLPLGKKRHMIIVTPQVVSDADLATKPTRPQASSTAPSTPRPTAARR